MELVDFVAQVPGFAELSHPEKIKLFAWYLHTHRGADRIPAASLTACYETLHYEVPKVGRELARLAERKPAEVLKDSIGIKLEARVRTAFDRKYGQLPSSLAVTQLLRDLPARIPALNERIFLAEALSCYQVKAFRAAIVMTWNLAFDHLIGWILSDNGRTAKFNTRISIRYPKKQQITIATRDDFEVFKESEVIEICNSANLISGGIAKVLQKELTRRNQAAHPSSLTFTQYQAEDCITDLCNNVILVLH